MSERDLPAALAAELFPPPSRPLCRWCRQPMPRLHRRPLAAYGVDLCSSTCVTDFNRETGER